MKDLILHPKTKDTINDLVSASPHAVLIIGPSGIGKKTLAKAIAEELLDVDNLETYPYALTIKAEDKSISIESVRQLEHFLSLKVPSDKKLNRVVIIEEADKLTLEAQNALLKTLEEPPHASVILMTLPSANQILPTLVSRAQKLFVTPSDESSLRDYFKGCPADKFNQAYLISGGLPGIMKSIIGDEDHPLKAATEEARAILSKDLYGRNLMINNLAKDSVKLMNTLQIMEQMAEISLKRGVNPARWEKVLKAAYTARISLSKNAQAKLTLLKLMFSL